MAGLNKGKGIDIRGYEINVDSNGNLTFENKGITSNNIFYLSTYDSLSAAITDIDIDNIVKFINQRKANIKRTLVKNFSKNVDYTLEKIEVGRGKPKENIL